jgi:hypothetical protein
MIYAIVLPLAVFIGWMAVDLANWDRTSFGVMAAVVFVLLIPVLLKWHYPILIFTWGTAITIFFLPGSPSLWMLMAGATFALAILRRIMQKRSAFLSAPSIATTLAALGIVVVVTAKLTGGMGIQAAGSSTIGGRGYYYILAAIIGYFALASIPIPADKQKRYVNLFLLSSLVTGVSNLIYFAGPSFYVLFLIFPMGFAAVQASTELSGSIVRVAGFATAASGIVYWQLATHGLRGVMTKWWRLLLVLVAIGIGSLGGYRSVLVSLGLVFILLFLLEGLLRSRIFPITLLGGCIVFAALIPLASKLPGSVQRTVSFLPLVKVDPWVSRDAASSLEWRFLIWRAVLPDLPRYIWLGKGYAINPTEMYLAAEAERRGRAQHSQTVSITGDYHNGPLSVYVPFGSFGLLAFLAFLVASIRVLFLNYRYGAEELRTINRFFLAYFGAKIIFFLFFFGGLAGELFQFTGIMGLSVALNHGVCRRPSMASRSVTFRKPLSEPAMLPGPA